MKPGMVEHTCNPVLRRLKQEAHEFEARRDYIVRQCLKKKKKVEAKRPVMLCNCPFSNNGIIRL
jgi:hypothetical protein